MITPMMITVLQLYDHMFTPLALCIYIYIYIYIHTYNHIHTLVNVVCLRA